MDQTTLLIVCFAGTAIISSLISFIISASISKKKSFRHINKVLKNAENAKSYKEVAAITAKIVDDHVVEHNIINGKINDLIIEKVNNIKKVASVRYDSTPDSGGKMSFSIALLNEKNSGIILTNIYMREASFLYLREINKGKCDIDLSDEERGVMLKATNSDK
ncbi:MAG: DUF4446 family protein [Clostridia bacterium]|nr:DUF4446 family protein [Clostridia bacterium]